MDVVKILEIAAGTCLLVAMFGFQLYVVLLAHRYKERSWGWGLTAALIFAPYIGTLFALLTRSRYRRERRENLLVAEASGVEEDMSLIRTPPRKLLAIAFGVVAVPFLVLPLAVGGLWWTIFQTPPRVAATPLPRVAVITAAPRVAVAAGPTILPTATPRCEGVMEFISGSWNGVMRENAEIHKEWTRIVDLDVSGSLTPLSRARMLLPLRKRLSDHVDSLKRLPLPAGARVMFVKYLGAQDALLKAIDEWVNDDRASSVSSVEKSNTLLQESNVVLQNMWVGCTGK